MATVNDILRVTLNFSMADASVGNLVHHYRVTAGTETDYIAIATAIETALEAGYAAAEVHISNDIIPISLELAEWDFIDSEWDGKASVAATVPAGGSASPPHPSGIAVLLRFPTAELRRQARKFLPGMLEVDSNTNQIGPVPLGQFVISAALLNNDVTAAALTLRPCTFNDTPLSPRFETWSDYSTTSIVNTNYAYQRRRQPGAGI